MFYFKRRIQLKVALLLVLVHTLQAQATHGVVTGLVLDSQTGRPVTGAVVAINGQSTEATVSDTAGRFTIPLSAGTYQVRIGNQLLVEFRRSLATLSSRLRE